MISLHANQAVLIGYPGSLKFEVCTGFGLIAVRRYQHKPSAIRSGKKNFRFGGAAQARESGFLAF